MLWITFSPPNTAILCQTPPVSVAVRRSGGLSVKLCLYVSDIIRQTSAEYLQYSASLLAKSAESGGDSRILRWRSEFPADYPSSESFSAGKVPLHGGYSTGKVNFHRKSTTPRQILHGRYSAADTLPWSEFPPDKCLSAAYTPQWILCWRSKFLP